MAPIIGDGVEQKNLHLKSPESNGLDHHHKENLDSGVMTGQGQVSGRNNNHIGNGKLVVPTNTNFEGRRIAVEINNVWKQYGSGKKKAAVLENFKMTVPEGTIYSLLGASGCGKTTLLACCVGRKKIDSGDILIFGSRPGTLESGVPGKRVGYMPQEIALYGEFTIKEAMQYFGRIYGMSLAQIDKKVEFLIEFLDLPTQTRIISTLSGGQQRRASFAIALLSDPEILILDEPTVGVDPLLRQSIWSHLCDLVVACKTTVIITTHYIEEAKQAHIIGLMRSGHLLAEDSPSNLLKTYCCTSLEDVFLKICMKDKQKKSDENDNNQSVSKEYESEGNGGVSKGHQNKTTIVLARNLPNILPEITIGTETKAKINGALHKNIPNGHHNNQGKSPDLGQTRNLEKYVPNLRELPFKLPEVQHRDTPKSTSGQNHRASSLSPYTERTRNRTGGILVMPEENGVVGLTFHKNYIRETTPDSSIIDDIESLSYSSPKSKLRTRRSLIRSQRENQQSQVAVSFRPCESLNRLRALIIKNYICMSRNLGFMFFVFLLPAIQVILFCLAIGGEPYDMRFGVVNHEFEGLVSECKADPGCSGTNLSCRYLDLLPDKSIKRVPYLTEVEAIEDVTKGLIWGYLSFPYNFSTLMLERGAAGNFADNTTIYGSRIKVQMDMSSQQIAFTLQRILIDTFRTFSSSLLEDCGYDPATGDIPLYFDTPVYGQNHPSFMEFMAPGIVLSIIFFMAVALTGSAFITERKEGMLDRSLVAGVTTGEVITAHMITQYVVMVGQTALVLLFMIVVFEVPVHGPLGWAIGITLLQGTCGMAFGFLISVLCTQERNAIQLALGSFYPNLLLSGVVWPIESMPQILRTISYLLPETLACESMRSILTRGWGITHPAVWPGFLSSVIWSLVFWALAILVARFSRHK